MDGFIAKVAPMFQKYGAQYKFHIISFAIAQACYESAWGDSYAATHYNNILGIGPHNPYPSWDACVKGYYTDTVLGGMASARNATTLDAYYSAFLDSGYCPDPNRTYYNAIMSIINSNNLTKYDAKSGQTLSGSPSTASSSSSSSSDSGGGGVVSDPNDVINAEAIDALIISIDPSVKPKDINYKKMTSNHVSGVMFKAGAFFDDKHKVYVYSRNENLDAQVRSAIDAGVRFGLFFDVRAKTVDEAEKECEQLYYAVSKYPPALGLWLHLMFAEKNKKKNNKIMDYYVKTMNNWGLMFGSGIYCTKSELDRIDWDKYQDNFYLWYVNRFSSASELSQITTVLSPDFFVI